MNVSAVALDPFSKSAAIYDNLHQGKDYDAHARIALSFMRSAFPQDRRPRVIEWGAGTGEFTKRLMQECDVVGFEPCEAMRRMANAKGLPVVPGDVRYCRPRDIVHPDDLAAQCMLFGTFSYACLREHDLNATLGNLEENARSASALVFDVINYATAISRLHRRYAKVSPCGTIHCNVDKEFDEQTGIVTICNEYCTPDESWTEVHKMRAFSPQELQYALRRHGFVVRNFFDPETGSLELHHRPYYLGVHAESV